jgi:hypothetical protein
MNPEFIHKKVQYMRDCYRNRDLVELKRQRMLLNWFLDDKTKDSIDLAIKRLEGQNLTPHELTENERILIDKANELLR